MSSKSAGVIKTNRSDKVIDWLTLNYLWIKAMHVFFMVAWMAGIFYLPRLLAYHTKVGADSQTAVIFQTMESRLNLIIMCPAAILTVVSGTMMLMVPGAIDWSQGWMHLKFIAILGLIIFHFMLNVWRRQLSSNNCQKSEKFFRIINEVPSLLLLIIVICVIVKPF
jgi:putative membrane protein